MINQNPGEIVKEWSQPNVPSKWTWVVQGKEHSRHCWCSIQVSWVSFTLVPCAHSPPAATCGAPNGSHLQHFQELALGTLEQHHQEVSGSYALFIAVTVCKQWLPNAWYKGTNPHSLIMWESPWGSVYTRALGGLRVRLHWAETTVLLCFFP